MMTNKTIVQLDIKDSTSLIRRLKFIEAQDLESYNELSINDKNELEKKVQEDIIKKLDKLIHLGLEKIGENYKDYITLTPLTPFPKIRYEFDQAKIIFESAGKAHRFAEAVHKFTEKDNKQPWTKEWFYLRIGIATGVIEVVYDQHFYRGTPFFRASRLEGKAEPGEIFIDQYTYDALSEDLQKMYLKLKKETIANCKDIIMTPYDACRYKVIDILDQHKQYLEEHKENCLS